MSASAPQFSIKDERNADGEQEYGGSIADGGAVAAYKINWLYMSPLLFAPIFPLSRIVFR